MTRRLMPGLIGRIAAATLLLLPIAAAANADDLEQAFKGKQITLYIGYDVGGTYGLYAQIVARHINRHVPGNPTIIVQSMPGAGGIKATNYVYNVAAKDGTVWMMPPDSIVISAVLSKDRIKYKAEAFQYLGTIAQSNAVIAVRADKGVKSIEDAKKTEVIVGTTGLGSQTFLIPALANAVLGTKFKFVHGYKGSQDVYRAIERKEVDTTSLTWQAWSTSRPQWVQSGYVVPILQVGINKDPELPSVPMAIDLVKNDDDRKIVSFMSSLGPIGRSLLVPPGVPAERVAAFRASFDKTMQDPQFLAEMKKRKFDVSPLTGAELQRIIEDMMKIPDDLAERAKSRIMGKEGKS